MSDLYDAIGLKIRELRENYGGKGLTQEKLAEKMHTTANTISRWETAAYKPSVKDLANLAQFFAVDISVFFPRTEDVRVQAFLSALGDLGDEDLEELTRYAQFRKARQTLEQAKRERKSKIE
jgi:transcriptional regulator with XRE-family HTH domain